MPKLCIIETQELKNMSSERAEVFSLLFAFMEKPRETLGYKNQNSILE